ncbi:MAG: ExeA family protein [Symbiobacteriia bacterium]
MYRRYFGFNTKPFSKTPDPKFLFYGKHYEEALQRVLYAIEERELALLTGDVGVGKTTLIRVLLEQLTPDQHAVSMIDPLLSPGQFMRALVKSLGNENPRRMRADLLEQTQNLLLSFHKQGRYPVVIIDEAQLCNKALLDEIRLITNFQLNHLNLLSVVLVGQTELRLKLKKPVYAPLRQRIGIHYHLQPLTQEDAMAYVNHRLRRAGVRPTTVFSPDALENMHRLTGGIPRVINVVATNAMIAAFSRKEKPISLETLEEAAADVV